jgi:hypothetical protein
MAELEVAAFLFFNCSILALAYAYAISHALNSMHMHVSIGAAARIERSILMWIAALVVVAPHK